MRGSARTRLAGVLAAAALAALTGCAELSTTPASAGTHGTTALAPSAGSPSSTPTAAPMPAPAGTALAALGTLPVKGRAPKTGYERDLFGPGWGDPDRNGCDTRNDVLARDLTGVTFKPGTHHCKVVAGTLADPYSGRTIRFVRGQGTSEAVQIDHVVAVSDAWQKGAQAWDAGRRAAFYNDPLNLLAVDGALNGQKGDGDAATWLPPAKGFRCTYVARQIAVKRGYDLWVTAAERDAMARVLSACPDQPLPDGGAAPPAPTSAAPAPQPAGVPFANCAAARAAGAAPVRRGDPGYGPALDGDGDGIECE
jgi:hypothetical protein